MEAAWHHLSPTRYSIVLGMIIQFSNKKKRRQEGFAWKMESSHLSDGSLSLIIHPHLPHFGSPTLWGLSWVDFSLSWSSLSQLLQLPMLLSADVFSGFFKTHWEQPQHFHSATVLLQMFFHLSICFRLFPTTWLAAVSHSPRLDHGWFGRRTVEQMIKYYEEHGPVGVSPLTHMRSSKAGCQVFEWLILGQHMIQQAIQVCLWYFTLQFACIIHTVKKGFLQMK